MKKIIIDETNQNQRLDKFLKRYLPNAGAGFLYRMLREKKIKLNGAKSEGKEILKTDDEIVIYFSDETLEKFMGTSKDDKNTAESSDLKAVRDFKNCIIYEDRDVCIINKPAGMLSQKSRPEDISACELLNMYLASGKNQDGLNINQFKPSAVNRLDRNTSGILVCAKTLPAAQELSEMFRDRTLKKEYLALVLGKVERKYDIKSYLKKDDKCNKVDVIEKFKEGYDKIETSYEPLGYLDNATLLNVDLLTGKTHQIRAHLSYMGNPIAGDSKYGNKKANGEFKRRYGLGRQFLHAYKLTFPDIKGRLKILSKKSFRAELPKELKVIEREVNYVRQRL